MEWRLGDSSGERARSPELAMALVVAAVAAAVAATFGPVAEWASWAAEFAPGWGSYDSHEDGDRRFVSDIGSGGPRIPLRAGQQVFVSWNAAVLRGGTLKITLFGPGSSCRAEISGAGLGTAVFRIVEPGLYLFEARGSATTRTNGDDHRFLGAIPAGYQMTYRASWGPLDEARRRQIAARRPTDQHREVACDPPVWARGKS
jgi:hypothetical protein